jgi:Arc/MetJ family transcription regulator
VAQARLIVASAWYVLTMMRDTIASSHASSAQHEGRSRMVKTHTTLDLDRELLREAAEALGTTRTTETVHAALREAVARRRRTWLARRDFSELKAALPELRSTRGAIPERPSEPGAT